jgi:leucyl aminopeptidase
MSGETAASLPDQFRSDNWFFQDITAYPVPTLAQPRKRNYPTELHHESLVFQMLTTSNPNRAWDDLGTLSAFHNRYYTSSYGVQSSQWIASHLQAIVNANNRSSDVRVNLFNHNWPQASVIVTIDAQTDTDETVIIGAHCDSTSPGMPTGSAPGANDDGSGSVTIMEVFRILMENDFYPDRIVEIQFYAAEEVGLWGSDDIAERYAQIGRNVYAMLQYDMNGYNPNGNWGYRIMYDRAYMDDELTDFLHILTEYTDLHTTTGSYGYAASDHASWARHDFPACHAKEGGSYPPIHTSGDVRSNLDRNYMHEFTKVGLGYVVELSLLQ